MDNKEYLKNLIDKFNANPTDGTFSKIESLMLAKVMDAQKVVNDLLDKRSEVEKQLIEAKKALDAIDANLNRERIKSDTYVETLCALR